METTCFREARRVLRSCATPPGSGRGSSCRHQRHAVSHCHFLPRHHEPTSGRPVRTLRSLPIPPRLATPSPACSPQAAVASVLGGFDSHAQQACAARCGRRPCRRRRVRNALRVRTAPVALTRTSTPCTLPSCSHRAIGPERIGWLHFNSRARRPEFEEAVAADAPVPRTPLRYIPHLLRLPTRPHRAHCHLPALLRPPMRALWGWL